MKISFLVTYYNQEKYVYDSLNSISKLIIPYDYEIIVGNDGSTDNTLQEVNKWKDIFGERLRIHTVTRDDGVVDGVVRAGNLRRELYKISTGDFFCILDGDDFYCDREFVREAIKEFAADATLSVVMFNYKMLYADRIEINKTAIVAGKLSNSEYIRKYYIHASACVFKAYRDELFMQPLNEAVYYDDNDITIYNLTRGNLLFISRPILSYRQQPDSAWNSLNRAEQGILNVVGADNECFMMPQYAKDIYYRYRSDILFTYFRKEYIEEYVGEIFLKRYRGIIDKSWVLSRGLLDYDNSSQQERDSVELVIDVLRKADIMEYERIKKIVYSERI